MTIGPGPVLTHFRPPRGWSAEVARALSRSGRPSWPAIKVALALIEAMLIAAAAIITVGLVAQGRPGAEIAAVAAAMAAPLAVLPLWVWGQYRIEQLASLRSASAPVAWAILLGAGLTVLAIRIATGDGTQPAAWAAAGWMAVGAVVLLHRAIVAVWLRRQLAQGHLIRDVAVIAPPGAADDGAALATELTALRGQPCRLTVLSVGRSGAAQTRRADRAEAVVRRLRKLAPDEILVVADPPFRGRPGKGPRLPAVLSKGLFTGLQRLPWPTTLAWARPGDARGFLFATVIEAPLSDGERFIKRTMDVLGASALLLVGLPLFALLALAIKLDSAGPVWFRQQRRGFDNEIFEVLKFRSMHVEMCDPLARSLTSPNDPRVTRVGRFLRRSSLDELPQLVNVLQGTMSLVGPRPHPLWAKAGERFYEEVVSDFALRYRVKPGITGWAQVNGWRGNTDSEDKLIRRFEHDMEYIRQWSLWLDIKILIRTPLASLLGENAY